MDKVIKFIKDDKGATMVEYALMITFVALVCIAAVTLLGTRVRDLFSNDDLANALK